MINDKKTRRLLLLTDDNFIAEVLGTYLCRDHIYVERIGSADDLVNAIASGADGVILDIAKRGVNADSILNVTARAQRWDIPMLIMSAQTRKALVDFAAVVRATDTISKSEAMTAIAARVRLCMLTPLKKPAKLDQLQWALA